MTNLQVFLVVGFKQLQHDIIVELKIPADARRISGFSRKCRADKAIVLGFYNKKGEPLPNLTHEYSRYDGNFVYTRGQVVRADDFDPERITCALRHSQGIDYRRYNEVKVFISQPMNGKDEQTILEERAKMVSRIKEQYPDAEILESYFEDYNPSTGNVGLKYLSKSLELLADADEAWFAPGWQNARGCRIENDCAIAYGITVHEI